MSTNKVFLGNLSWGVTGDSLADLLRDEGYDFRSAKVILDRETGRSRGFAFVEFETPEAAAEAIAGLDGHVIDGRPLRAMEATDRSDRGGGGRDRKDARSAGGGGGGGRSAVPEGGSGYGGGSFDDRGHFDGGGRRREHHRPRRRNNDGDWGG